MVAKVGFEGPGSLEGWRGVAKLGFQASLPGVAKPGCEGVIPGCIGVMLECMGVCEPCTAGIHHMRETKSPK